MASKNYTPYEIARLILHCLHNEASEQEEATLEEWLKESDANRRFYESMKSRSHFTKGLKEYSGYDSRQDWKLVRKGLARRKFDLSFSWKRYAAVFIGLFIASGIYWNLSRNPKTYTNGRGSPRFNFTGFQAGLY